MIAMRKFLLLGVFNCLLLVVFAQRTYKASSVLASGNWFKISVAEDGIYRIDVSFLNSLGLTGSIPSSQIRIFGNGGAMLPEANSSQPIDDLEENCSGADAAGIVLGAKVPIILTSRADSVPTRLASCAVAGLVAQARRSATSGAVR